MKKRHFEGNSQSDLKRNILIVDDEAVVRELLQTFLEDQGFHVTTTASGIEGVRLAEKLPIHLIITDICLADSDGLEVLRKLKKMRPSRPVIVMSGFSQADEMFEMAKKGGASACVSKTTPLSRLLTEIQHALDRTSKASSEEPEDRPDTRKPSDASADVAPPETLGTLPATSQPAESPRKPAAAIGTRKETRTADVPDRNAPQVAERISVAPGSERFDFGLEVFSRMLSAYHPNLGNTTIRAVAVCEALGESLELPAEQRQDLLWAAALHDIGLAQIDRRAVGKWMTQPDESSEEDILMIKRHPERSRQMLEFCPAFKNAAEIIVAHHEHWDGSGFPAGLRMEMIPWLSRLLSAVIFYCGTHNPNPKTLVELKTRCGGMFDPRAVESVAAVLEGFTLPKGERELMAYQTRPEMVLASDIRNWDGMLILAKGTVLDNTTTTKIHRLSAAAQIDARILVCC